MRRLLISVGLVLCGSSVCVAQENAARRGDPIHSPECVQALAALDARDGARARTTASVGAAASASAASTPSQDLARRARDPSRDTASGIERENLRRQAARVCLGGPDGAQRPPPLAGVPPISVPPVGALPPIGRTPTPQPARPALPPIQPPTVVTNCDANGCWTNSGTRLNRIGPNLLGPSGVCTQHGALLNCP